MSDGFLSRWSRRKRGDQAEETAPAQAAPPEPVEAEAGEAEAPDAVLSPEELAQLPSLDELTAETDLAAFLRAGVPRALRNAALRRAWVLDPKIRDFVCEAREYAYDWNVPGGVPGNGDLLPTDDVAGMLRRIFSDGPPEPAGADETAEEAKDEAGACDPVSRRGESEAASDVGEPASSDDDVAAQRDPLGSAVDKPAVIQSEKAAAGPALLPPIEEFAARQPERVTASTPAIVPKRRHGRAAPI